MEPSIHCDSGGILGLLDLVDNHGEAFAVDLLRLGYHLEHLGTPQLTWRDAILLANHAPRGSELAVAVGGDTQRWDDLTYLIASVVDLLAWANYQRAGKKTGRKPTPIPRPGSNTKKQHWGSGALPVNQLNHWIGMKEKEGSDG